MPSLTDPLLPVRLIISGKFWDSQLYSGKLILFGLSGELIRWSWPKLIAALPVPEELRIAAHFAFLGNQQLYEEGARRLVQDPQIRELLLTKFRQLGARSPWEASPQRLGVQDNPLPFPHSDSEAHYHTLFVSNRDGLFSAPIGNEDGPSVRISEVPTFNIAAKYETVAQAAGSDGLFAVRVRTRGVNRQHPVYSPSHVSALQCFRCEWGASSIIAAGQRDEVYVAPYESPEGTGRTLGRRRSEREFRRVIRSSDIFQSKTSSSMGYTWGAGDKIYQIADGHVQVLKHRLIKREHSFSVKGTLPVDGGSPMGEIVCARSAPFGSVVETHDGLLVMLTNGESFAIPGEPTSWRVFPRSKNYLNHLHIMYSDRIEVWAFTHDYFVNQREKLLGLAVSDLDD